MLTRTVCPWGTRHTRSRKATRSARIAAHAKRQKRVLTEDIVHSYSMLTSEWEKGKENTERNTIAISYFNKEVHVLTLITTMWLAEEMIHRWCVHIARTGKHKHC